MSDELKVLRTYAVSILFERQHGVNLTKQLRLGEFFACSEDEALGMALRVFRDECDVHKEANSCIELVLLIGEADE